MSKGIRASRRKLTGLGQNQAPSRYLRLKSPHGLLLLPLPSKEMHFKEEACGQQLGSIFKDPPKDS